MKSIFKKITITLIVFTMLASYLPLLSQVKAEELDYGQGVPDLEEYETVEDYINDYYPEYKNSDKSEITELYIGYANVKNLTGLYDYKNLEKIEFWDIGIEKIDLAKLSKLKTLVIGFGYFDVDIISELTNLEKLEISDAGTTNYANNLDLSKMKNLKELKISKVEHVTKEEKVEPITVTGIENLTNLETLILDEVIAEDLNASKLVNLKELELVGCLNNIGIHTTVSGIKNLTNLQKLGLSLLVCEEELNLLTNLKSLRLEQVNKEMEVLSSYDYEYSRKIIDDLKIESLTRLEELILKDMTYKELNLKNLTNLKTLTVSDIENEEYERPIIEEIIDLSKLSKLENLGLDQVHSNTDNLVSNLTNLSTLSISLLYEVDSLRLRDYSKLGIENLVNLKDIYLYYINNSFSLANCKKLENIQLSAEGDFTGKTIDLRRFR